MKKDLTVLTILLAPIFVFAQMGAVLPQGISYLPERGDIVLSPRFYKADWETKYKEFYANKIGWTYAWSKYAPVGIQQNIQVQCTLPYWLPATHPSANDMKCLDNTGAPRGITTTDPTTGAQTVTLIPNWTSAAWKAYELAEAQKMVDAGCRSFMQDDIIRNTDGLICYNASRAPITSVETVSAYHQEMHAAIRAYALSRGITTPITFSGNIHNKQFLRSNFSWVNPHIDFYTAEYYTATEDTSPAELVAFVEKLKQETITSVITISNPSDTKNKRVIPSIYALGMTAVAPFDVFTGFGTPRYSPDPVLFAGIFKMIGQNRAVFKDFALATSSMSNFVNEIPAMGSVTKVATVGTSKTVTWSRGFEFKDVAKGRVVTIGSRVYKTTAPSADGVLFLPLSATVSVGDPISIVTGQYLIATHNHVSNPNRKAVHLVNWNATDRVAYLHLKKSEYPTPPNKLITSKNATPQPVAYTAQGAYWVYPVLNIDSYAVYYADADAPTPPLFASCTLGTTNIAHGTSITAYSADKVAFGATCTSISQQRTCTDGSLSGTYTNQSCSVAPDPILALPHVGEITKIDTTSSTTTITVSWTKQSSYKAIPSKSTVYIFNKNTRLTRTEKTTGPTTVGNLYLPKGTVISVGEYVSLSPIVTQ